MRCKASAKRNLGDGESIAGSVLSWWRTRPAQCFDEKAQAAVKTLGRELSTTSPKWHGAIDAATAIGHVLRLEAPLQPSARVDRAMTVLLACAFDDAAAALVLAHMVRRTSLGARKRALIASSWLKHEAVRARLADLRRRPALPSTDEGQIP